MRYKTNETGENIPVITSSRWKPTKPEERWVAEVKDSRGRDRYRPILGDIPWLAMQKKQDAINQIIIHSEMNGQFCEYQLVEMK